MTFVYKLTFQCGKTIEKTVDAMDARTASVEVLNGLSDYQQDTLIDVEAVEAEVV